MRTTREIWSSSQGLRRVNVLGHLQTEEPWEVGDEMTDPDPEDRETDQDDWEMDDQDDED